MNEPPQVMSSGTCGCLGYDLTQGDDYKTILDMLCFAEFFIGTYSEDIQRQVVEILCSGVVNYGEHSQVNEVVDLLDIVCWNNRVRYPVSARTIILPHGTHTPCMFPLCIRSNRSVVRNSEGMCLHSWCWTIQ